MEMEKLNLPKEKLVNPSYFITIQIKNTYLIRYHLRMNIMSFL